MKNFIMTAVLAFSWVFAQGQTYPINGPDATICAGIFADSGGEGATGYLDNEVYEITICPDGSGGTALELNMLIFTLSLDPDATGNVDTLFFYDGPNTTAPLLGIHTGNNPPNIVSASYANSINTGGCLTVRFVSNSTGVGAFGGLISCYTPCAPPTAVATMGATSPAKVCIGEPITFDASASTASGTFGIAEYRWNFDDGTIDSLSGAEVTHAYDAPGAYFVRLLLTDDSPDECQNTNAVDLRVFVGTEPDFSALVLDSVTICLGESVPLSGVGVEAVTFSTTPQVDLGGPVYLPDVLNTPFISELTFTNFPAGTLIQNVNQIESICVSMEHSFMGDLDLILRCPNQQEVYLVDFFGPNSGGPTFIGDALDTEEDPPVPGTCFDYCWTPNATNGTFSTSANDGTTENVQPATVTPFNDLGAPNFVLSPGDYQSEQPLSQLVGCPLNGTWTFIAIDNQGADDGFICSWSVSFDPALYPPLVEFTPVLGVNDPDSAGWEGTDVTTDPTNPLLATATPTTEGTFEYTFSVTDDFGCTYDTSMFVTVLPGIPSPLTIVGDDEICTGTLSQLSAPAGYTGYTWNNGFTGQSISVGAGDYTVTVFSGDCSLESEPFTVTGVPSPSPEISGPGFSCGGALAGLSTTEEYASYQWSNGSTTPSISAGTGSYTVTVTNAEGCSGTSDVFGVTVGSDPQAAYSTDPVSPQGIGTTVDFTDLSQGNGSPIVEWEWNLGLPDATSSVPSPTYTYNTPGIYPITLTITTADNCTSTITGSFQILPESIIIPNVFTPNNDTRNDVFEIENGQFYENTLEVFDRWGKRVFEKKNYQNTWNAPGIPDGTYYYIFTTERDGKEYTGHVTILR